MAYLDKIETRIAGIPCLIGVTSYGRPAYTAGAPENCDPGECAEYDVLDMRGRPAPWLVQKMKMADITRILELIDAVNREWA